MSRIELKEYDKKEEIKHGRLVTFDVIMEPYPDKRSRTIRVWLPMKYDEKKRFPVLYMHDAQNLFSGFDECFKWYAEREMEKLDAEGLQAIIVGIDTSSERGSELCPNLPLVGRFATDKRMISTPTGNLYADFVVSYLKPIIDENFMTLRDSEHTGIGGASMGGLISHYMAMRNPEVFGRALVFSPAYPCHGYEYINSKFEEYDFSRIQNSKFFIFSGGVEIEKEIMEQIFPIYNKMLEKGFSEKNIAVMIDSRERHHETAWNKYFAEAFRFLFSKSN